MPDINILTVDGSALVGEAAEIRFDISFLSPPQSGETMLQILASREFAEATRNSMQSQVRKHFGKQYFLNRFEVNPAEQTVIASINTLFDNEINLESIAKQAASVTEAVRDSMLATIQAAAEERPMVRANWSQGKDLFNPSLLLSQDTPSPQLEARLAFLRRRRQRLSRIRSIAIALAASLVLIGVPTVFLFEIVLYGLPYLALYVAMAAALALVSGSQAAEVDSESREIANALDLRQITTADRRSRAEKLFREHSFELKRYYDQTLSQGKTIYLVGLGCLLLGFAVIGVSLLLVIEGGKSDSYEQVIIGALGAIAGILADYIAVVYLKMFSQTVQAVTGFHRRFVMTHHLHFGNLLAATIDDEELRHKTLAAMAEKLSESDGPRDKAEQSTNGTVTAGQVPAS